MTQHRDNTGKEELVGKIIVLIARCMSQIGDFSQDSESRQRVDEAYRYWAREAITLISQAIAEGKVMLTKVPPELPGEVERGENIIYLVKGRAIEVEGTQVWLGGWIDKVHCQYGATTLIALSPAERKDGTGPLTGTGMVHHPNTGKEEGGEWDGGNQR